MDMSKAIREGRERLGMSQEALAERLGVSRQAVSKWEMGTSVPSPENRRALSEILGTDLQVERETAPPVPLRRWKRLTLAAGLPLPGAAGGAGLDPLQRASGRPDLRPVPLADPRQPLFSFGSAAGVRGWPNSLRLSVERDRPGFCLLNECPASCKILQILFLLLR